MANYYTDFSSYSTGSLPTGWTERYNGTSQYTVQTGGDDKILKCGSASDNRKACTWNTVDSDANRDNVEVRVQFRTKSTSGTSGGVIVRGSGSTGSETGYTAGILNTSVYCNKYVSGSATTLFTSTAFGTLAADTDYEFVFRVNGSNIGVRIYAKGGGDPGPGANVTATDSSVTGVGWAGVFGFTGAGKLEYDKIAIATNGDTATYTAGTTVAPSSGHVVISGKVPSVTRTGNQAVAVSNGHLALSGKVPTVIVGGNRVVAVIKGHLSITGKTPTVSTSTITISSPTDRGTLDLPNCSVTPNGSTPTITVKNRYFFEGANGARNCFFQVTGVNGMTPVFDCDKSNTEGTWAQKWKYSYTGLLGSWVDFDNFSSLSSPNVYRSSNNSAFTQDTVYVSMHYPWRVGYTLPWIQSLVASGFVSEPPSSAGNTYQFGTRSATTNGATDGAGDTVAAQPLFSFRISSGGLAPDGLPKRRVVLIGGVHCSEDTGNYVLKGAVEYILSGAAQAVTYRSWFDTDIYPLVSSAGKAGGVQRGDLQVGHRTYDTNRHWLESTMETLNLHKTAILGDTGGSAKVFFDFHSTHLSASPGDFIETNSTVITKWTNAFHVYEPSTAVTPSDGSAGLQFSSWWALSTLGAQYCITPEITNVANISLSSLALYGQHHIQAIADLAAAGEWALIAPATGHVVVSGKQPTVIRSGGTIVAAAKGHLAVSGKVPSVVRGNGTYIYPAKGGLAVSGKTPSVSRTANAAVLATKGHLALSGKVPSVIQYPASPVIAAGKGAMHFSGHAPSVVQADPSRSTGAGSSRNKRVYLERQGKILVFKNAHKAASFVSAEKKAQRVEPEQKPSKQPLKRTGTAPEAVAKPATKATPAPLQSIPLESIRKTVSSVVPEDGVTQMINNAALDALMTMYDRALVQQEEEDLALLIMGML